MFLHAGYMLQGEACFKFCTCVGPTHGVLTSASLTAVSGNRTSKGREMYLYPEEFHLSQR